MSSRCWCYTLNNYSLEEQLAVETIDCRYHIYGIEVGEAGTPHLQGYIEFGSVKRLSGCKKLIVRAHWEPRKGTREEARNYCMKDNEFMEFGEWGAGGQGKRNDIERLVTAIKEQKSVMEIIDEMPQVAANNLRFMDRVIAVTEKERTRDFRRVEVCALIGDAGCGKTRIVHEICSGVFTVNAGEAFPFDGYEGEDAILIDDFYGDIKYHELLRILDGHQYRVNIKGGHRYAQWTKVFITSNKEPKDWYKAGLTPALARRISHVTTFCNEVAGNTVEPPPLEI